MYSSSCNSIAYVKLATKFAGLSTGFLGPQFQSPLTTLWQIGKTSFGHQVTENTTFRSDVRIDATEKHEQGFNSVIHDDYE